MRNIEAYTGTYVQSDFEMRYQVAYRKKKVVELIRQWPHNRVLEIGCGLNPVLTVLHDYQKYTIVEPSEQFIENAMKNNKSDGVNFINKLFEDAIPELKEESFDYIIISGLLHEVEKPKEFISKVHHVANKGTVIHVNVPNMKSFHRLLAYESGLIQSIYSKSSRNDDLQQNTNFDIQSLKEILIQSAQNIGAEIEILEEGSYFVKPFTHSQMERCLQEGIFDEKVIEGFNQMTKYMPDLGSEIYVNYRIVKNGAASC